MRKLIVHGCWSKAKKVGILFTFCCLLSFQGLSQKVSTLISKNKIVLGEQIFVKIKIDGIAPAEIQQRFLFPDTVNHLEILSDTLEQLNRSTLLHTLTITSFDSGYWQLPAFTMQLTNQKTLSTTPLNITVLPIDISGMEDYHDIKDILEITPENNWLIIAILILLALISFFGILWFMNKKQVNEEKKIDPADLEQLYYATLKKLDTIATSRLNSKEEAVIVFTQTSETVRSFIDKAKNQKTTHLTTGEYIVEHKNQLSSADTENGYFQFLRLADAVKFARYLPPAEETTAALPKLKEVVRSVYEQTKSKV